MGNVNARSLGKLQREAQNGDFDMILHVGMYIIGGEIVFKFFKNF